MTGQWVFKISGWNEYYLYGACHNWTKSILKLFSCDKICLSGKCYDWIKEYSRYQVVMSSAYVTRG